MFALLILPILVSGFIVLSINPKEKLKLHRYDGQLLYLKAAKIGLRYFFIVVVLSLLFKDLTFQVEFSSNINILNFEKSIEINEKIDPSLVSHIAKTITKAKNENKVSQDTLELSWLLSLSILTVSSAYIISLFKKCRVYIQNRIAKSLYMQNEAHTIYMLGEILKDSPLDYIFYESFTKRKPLLITLDSRKVYIGFVNKLAEPSESEEPNQEISIVPAISGYRDKDTLKVILKNDYTLPDSTDSSIVIKVDQIDTVSWFTHDIYININGNIESEESVFGEKEDTDDSSSIKENCEVCKKTKVKVGSFILMKN